MCGNIYFCVFYQSWYDRLSAVDTERGRFHKAFDEFSTNRKRNQRKFETYYSCDPAGKIYYYSRRSRLILHVHGALRNGGYFADTISEWE